MEPSRYHLCALLLPHSRAAVSSGKEFVCTSCTLDLADDSLDCLLLVATEVYIFETHRSVTNGETVFN